jgi:hypothetical protein
MKKAKPKVVTLAYPLKVGNKYKITEANVFSDCTVGFVCTVISESQVVFTDVFPGQSIEMPQNIYPTRFKKGQPKGIKL